MKTKMPSGLLVEFLVGSVVVLFISASATFAQTEAKTLRILYSGDVAGYLEPCG